MTYAQAKIIIWNPYCYPPSKIQGASAYILGTIDADQEDLNQACVVFNCRNMTFSQSGAKAAATDRS